MTGEALKYLVQNGFSEAYGARWENDFVHKKAIVITDGKSQDYFRGTVTEWSAAAKVSRTETSVIRHQK